MKRLLVSVLMTVAMVSTFVVAIPRQASAAIAPGCGDGTRNFLEFPLWYQYLDIGPEVQADSQGNPTIVDDCAIIGPLHSEGERAGKLNWELVIGRVALAVIEILLRIASLVAVGYVLYGGFRYILSQGEPENAKSARQTILNGVIGLALTIIATGAVAFISSVLTGGPTAYRDTMTTRTYES